MFFGLALMAAGAILFLQQGCGPSESKPAKNTRKSDGQTKREAAVEDKLAEKWLPAGTSKSLFDGKTLTGWKDLQFSGKGGVDVEKGSIVLEMGGPMTGIAWTGRVVRNNYELSLEGRKLEGIDFFCTTTFPVGDAFCSLVVGGWGGGVVGLSNVDGHDASENSTSKLMAFKKNQWYRVRIRVTDAAVEAWIDGEQVVKQSRKGHKFGVRSEVEMCRPLGIATWATKGAVRNIEIRSLDNREPAPNAKHEQPKKP
jgi:hypothetical protein